MRLLGNGKFWLAKGEVVPVVCKCGHVYQPDAGSMVSKCPKCQHVTIHDEQGVENVRRPHD